MAYNFAMSQEIRTIFENGVFRPIDPTVVPPQGEFFVVVKKPSTSSDVDMSEDADVLRQQREALKLFFEQAESLPLEVADDGFGGADHDAALYGDQQ